MQVEQHNIQTKVEKVETLVTEKCIQIEEVAKEARAATKKCSEMERYVR